ncbi:MAG TPA: PAS domain S-box protein [Cyclobacteriaceae bacterium]|nr:PAS domain S-box protein [Cyclobacteriaceae bacterium]
MEKEKKRFRIRFTIGNKILAGFLSLIILFIINATIIFFTGNNIDKVVEQSSQNIRPSKDAINELILMVTRSKMLITNWVYLQSNTDDKQALRELHGNYYPELKDKVTKLMPQWENDSQRWLMDTVFIKFEAMMEAQKSVMSQLVTFENYEDPLTKLLAEDAIESQIIPQTTAITKLLDKIADLQATVTAESDAQLTASSKMLRSITLILSAITVALGLVSAFLMIRSITVPVNYLKDIVVKLGRGELVEDKNTKFNNDEIGEMAAAMDNLVNGLKDTTLFAENIGKGTYATDFQPLSEHDVLGNALINMRDNLSRVADEDKKRNWATEGLAKFGEILRTNTNDLNKLTDEIILNLVKYLKANQGAIYIIDDDQSGEDPTMSMKACYAWDKKKFLNQKVHRGEGLAGQAWQEGDLIYLTEVPQNYIRITSGLGDANPTSVLIVPLKLNEQIFGVVEMASFGQFHDFEMEFVQKIAESIASTISSVKVNARTQRLLEESQEMTEQMRAQEEEMRQNMEELQATQEEMNRGQAESESTMRVINDAMAVVEFDPDGNILKVNSNFLDLMGYKQDEIVGEHHRVFVGKDERNSDSYKNFWRDLASGRTNRGDFKHINKKGEDVWLRASYSPIKDKSGNVVRVMNVAYDITSLMKSK